MQNHRKHLQLSTTCRFENGSKSVSMSHLLIKYLVCNFDQNALQKLHFVVWQVHNKTQLTKSRFAESTLKLGNALRMFKHGYYVYIDFLPPISQGPICQEHTAIYLAHHPEPRGKRNSCLIRNQVCLRYVFSFQRYNWQNFFRNISGKTKLCTWIEWVEFHFTFLI